MKNPFRDIDVEYKKKTRYAIAMVVLAVIFLAVLVKIMPGVRRAWIVALHVLKPLLIGVVICYLLNPAVKFFDSKLQKIFGGKKWTHAVATCIVLVLLLLLIAGIIVLLVYSAARQIIKIDYTSFIQFVEAQIASTESFKDIVEKFFEGQNIQIPSFMKNVSSWIGGFVGGVVSFFTTMLFGIIFGVYFLLDGNNIIQYWKRVISAYVKPEGVKALDQFVKDADHCFSGYIRGQVIDAFIVGILTTIALTFANMPYAILIGALTGFGNLIPYIGPILGYGSIVIINVVNYNPRMLVIGLVVLVIIMFIDGNIINPKLLAGNVKVHPLVVVSALIAGGAVGGLVGMVIAVPVAAFIKIQFEKIVDMRIKENDKEQ